MPLVQFTDANDRKIFVNAALVRLVRPGSRGGITRLYFDNEHFVVVRGETADIADALGPAP